MLKKHGKHYIIISEVRWNLMNANVLISTAMICSLWDTHKKDTLDLMIPFLKYIIAKQTQIGKEVNIDLIIDSFKSEFGYESIPRNVIISMLNRLSPSVLNKKQGKFTLIASLDKEYSDFKKRHCLYKEHRNAVGRSLSKYLNENISNIQTSYSPENALSALIGFFIANGLIISQTPEQLSLIKKNKDDKIIYAIARFIIQEHKNSSEIFDYMIDMVKGFFVSTAISFQPNNLSLPHTKFKDLCCYLDTPVILDALGLRLESGKKAALELIDMLRTEQATVCCFEHTVEEIRDIIKAYRYSLLNPGKKITYNTLEQWDEQKLSVDQVSRYLKLLDKRIEALDIKIVGMPAKREAPAKGLNIEKFKRELKKHVPYHSPVAYKNDILSVIGVTGLRKGHVASDLEKCRHIFITSNTPLVAIVSNCLYAPEDSVPPTISDTTMSSIVWFKCSSSHKDYPKYKLIENALLAMEPSPTFLNVFYAEVDRLLAENEISDEEAAVIRTDIHIRRDIVAAVSGDPTQINKNTVHKMRDNLRKRYSCESGQQAEENYRQFLIQKTKNNQALHTLVEQIEACGEKRKNTITKILNIVAYILLILLAIALIGFSVAALLKDEKYWFGTVFLLVLEIFGALDLLLGKMRFVQKIIHMIANHYSDKAMEKKRQELSPIISTLQENEV